MSDIEREETMAALAQLIAEKPVAMMTTIADDGSLHARPMLTANTSFDAELWFFTDPGDRKLNEIRSNSHVGLTYSNQARQKFASISGSAVHVTDLRKSETLWNAEIAKWFPAGTSFSDLWLIVVQVQRAEYWEDNMGRLGRMIEFVKSMVTGSSPDVTVHGSINWSATEAGKILKDSPTRS